MSESSPMTGEKTGGGKAAAPVVPRENLLLRIAFSVTPEKKFVTERNFGI